MNGPSFQLAAAIRSYTAGHSLNDCDDDNCLLCAAAAALWMCEVNEPVPVEDMPVTLYGRGRPRITADADDTTERRTCKSCWQSKPLDEFQSTTPGNRRHKCRRCQATRRTVREAVA